MVAKQRYSRVNFNRVLIFVLTLAVLLMDGFQRSDLTFTLALLLWLWLAVFARMEAKILSLIRDLRPATHESSTSSHRHTASSGKILTTAGVGRGPN